MRSALIGLVLVTAYPAAAQSPAAPAVIRVVGHGSVETPPDVAILNYEARGEGATSDDAVRALVETREAIDAALAGKAQVRTGRLAIRAARDKACDDSNNSYSPVTRVSTGPCAIRGYVATLAFVAKVKPVGDAGTLLGLIGRLGAREPRLESFAIGNPTAAAQAAMTAAVQDARRQAQAIAAASGASLGRLRRVEDTRAATFEASDIIVTAVAAPPPPPAPPPVTVKLAPEPIETSATLNVEFEVGPPGAS